MKAPTLGRKKEVRSSATSRINRRDSVLTAVPQVTLNNGQSIPQLGFGVFQIEPKTPSRR